jgi:hypothetical protein
MSLHLIFLLHFGQIHEESMGCLICSAITCYNVILFQQNDFLNIVTWIKKPNSRDLMIHPKILLYQGRLAPLPLTSQVPYKRED